MQPCWAGPIPVPSRHWHLDVCGGNGGESLSLIYFPAQPLCFGSQFIKFYCITINMQNSYLKGIQKYNQEREKKKKPFLRKRGKINPLLSVEWHLGSLVLIHFFFLSSSDIQGLSLFDGWGVGLRGSLLGGQAPNVAENFWRFCVYGHAISFAFSPLFLIFEVGKTATYGFL